MPRAPRVHFPGAVYHAMARGVEGRDVFLDGREYRRFLGIMAAVRKEIGFETVAYCLMPNHFHLAVKVEYVPLQTIMQRLLTSYAMWFNLQHQRQGHLFQARYKAIVCTSESYLLALMRYIHHNPVRAGLCRSASEWPWSSFDAADPLSAAEDFDPWPRIELPALPSLSRTDCGPDPESLDQIALYLFPGAEARKELRSHRRLPELVSMRRDFARSAVAKGHGPTAIARWLGRSPQSVHQLLRSSHGHLLDELEA